MMQMEVLSNRSPEFPSAILLASHADVVMNNNVLHRMVRPTEQGTEVVSVNRLVNVVPFRRIYRFDRKDELNDFCNELLRRPLVIQPVVHFGRGLGKGSLACGMCYKDNKWVMMINQTHPKILSRLQIGLDAAKNAMARGQSCEIRFAFTKMVEEIYKKTLTKSEQENAASRLDLVKSFFRYAEWEYGDLIIRFHGYAALMGRGGGLRDMTTLNLTFSFEDLMYEEISWKTLEAEFFPQPHLAPVTEDEIRESLPGWTVNGISPLENIGDVVPTANYSYAQAGRLYESFRKKKRRPKAEVGDQAEGGAPHPRPTVTDGIELKVMGHEGHWQQRGDNEYDREHHEDRRDYGAEDAYSHRAGYDKNGYQNGPYQWQGQYPEDDGFYEERGAKPKRVQQHSAHSDLYPEVKVNRGKPKSPRGDGIYPSASSMEGPSPYANAPPHQSPSPYANTPPQQSPGPYANAPPHQSPSPYANVAPRTRQDTPLGEQFTRLRMQGSDRSSHSETGSCVADSGICSDSDGHVREGSYEKPFNHNAQKHSPTHPYAMDNHGFHSDESDVSEAMRKHRELIAKMMGGAQPQTAEVDVSVEKSRYYDNRQQRYASQSSDRDSGGYYAGRSGPLPSPYSKSGVPSPNSLNGHDYAASVNASYGQGRGHSQMAQRSMQPVDESFI